MGKNKYRCVLCGHIRWVRTYPRSKCFCRIPFPSRYMYLKFQIRDFFIWLHQELKILACKRYIGKDEWVRVK